METVGSLTGANVLARTRAQDLESVRKINCWASDIEDISVVRQMPNLEVCSVSVNYITTLEDFSYCPNLQELYIRNNKIENLSEICYLKDLPKLRILWLADNPCATGDNYRKTVLRNLPHLQKLDNIVVQDEEIPKAAEEGEELSLPHTNGGNDVGEELSLPHTKGGNDVTENGNGAIGDTSSTEKPTETGTMAAVTLSWGETNKIREELGLKPISLAKMTPPRSAPTGATRARNAHVLQAVLILVKELDRDSLEIVDTAIKRRLDVL